VVGIITVIDLSHTTSTQGTEAQTYLPLTAERNGRQQEGEVIVAEDIELVAFERPEIDVRTAIDELAVALQLDVLQIAIREIIVLTILRRSSLIGSSRIIV
jgi:hypothetical protein